MTYSHVIFARLLYLDQTFSRSGCSQLYSLS